MPNAALCTAPILGEDLSTKGYMLFWLYDDATYEIVAPFPSRDAALLYARAEFPNAVDMGA